MGERWKWVTMMVLLVVWTVGVDVKSVELEVGKPSLRFPGDRPLKIALMADLHYGENAWSDWAPLADFKSTGVQDYILDSETPDFVVYLGDQVTANNVIAANSSNYWAQAVDPAVKRSIPFASVFGNHDDAFMVYDMSWFGPSGIPGLPAEGVGYYHGTTREELMAAEVEMTSSLSQAGPNSLWPSLSNYALTIASFNDPGRAATILYFLDSGGGTYPELLSASQIAWFQQKSNAINPDGSIPELVFFHIPTAAHLKLGPQAGTQIPAPCVGSINLEAVDAQVTDWGLMDVLRQKASVKAVFTGHNHGLDWCCPDSNLWMCFARHTGYGGYGTWTRGSRVLELMESPQFEMKSWIRLEDGSIVAQSKLT